MAFIEERLDTTISPRMTSGARFMTEIKTSRSGFEFRNRRWQDPLREYEIAFSNRNMAALQSLTTFAYKTGGAFSGFRMKDWMDFDTSDGNGDADENPQELGMGDGVTTKFKLYKYYGSYARRIFKPTSFVKVFINGSNTTQVSVDTTTGVVTFNNPPGIGKHLTWYGAFDVPVRFEEDVLGLISEFHRSGRTGVIGLREIRLKDVQI